VAGAGYVASRKLSADDSRRQPSQEKPESM
jgi:hypothetical protein